jgi:D-arabinose 1-dehydrogenase-like Zn-dependent alcohol dehydrogenase
MPLIMGTHRVGAVTVGSRADQLALGEFCARHGISPVIDAVFDVGQIDEAYGKVAQGAFGKVVVRL